MAVCWMMTAMAMVSLIIGIRPIRTPVSPLPTRAACEGDPDQDGLPTATDPAPLDACLPDPQALACATGDTDGDGLQNSQDPAPLDVCRPVPPLGVSCQPALYLYLPLVLQ